MILTQSCLEKQALLLYYQSSNFRAPQSNLPAVYPSSSSCTPCVHLVCSVYVSYPTPFTAFSTAATTTSTSSTVEESVGRPPAKLLLLLLLLLLLNKIWVEDLWAKTAHNTAFWSSSRNNNDNNNEWKNQSERLMFWWIHTDTEYYSGL